MLIHFFTAFWGHKYVLEADIINPLHLEPLLSASPGDTGQKEYKLKNDCDCKIVTPF